MARAALVLDASVIVKWFSKEGEDDLEKALRIRASHVYGESTIVVPDVLYHEVTNALIHKQALTLEEVILAVEFLFKLSMSTVHMTDELVSASARLARQNGITEYDACYAAVAAKYDCPLVTSNPKHQGKAQQLGCKVISLNNWHGSFDS